MNHTFYQQIISDDDHGYAWNHMLKRQFVMFYPSLLQNPSLPLTQTYLLY